MADLSILAGDSVAEVDSVIPTAKIGYVLTKADIVFTTVTAGILAVRAEVTDIWPNVDSQNKSLLEILTVSDLTVIGNSKNFTEAITNQDNITDIVTGVNKSETLLATEVFNRTISFNRDFDLDQVSATDPNKLIKPGAPINGNLFNAAVLGWEFFGIGELRLNITTNKGDTASPSSALGHSITKNLNDAQVSNDGISVSLGKDSTLISEGTASDQFNVALQTYFVFNGAALNNRPIN